MEACILICRAKKDETRRGKTLFINATGKVHREGTYSYLSEDDIQTISKAYEDYSEIEGFCKIAAVQEILEHEGSLRVSRYVSGVTEETDADFSTEEIAVDWMQASANVQASYRALAALISGGASNDC